MVYERRGRFLLSTEARTVDGFWVSIPPFVDAGLEPADRTLGSMVSCLIDLSIEGVDSPAPDENLFEPVLRWAGVKSYGTFMAGTRCVDITDEAGFVSITPMRNAGTRGGFEYLDEHRQVLDSPSTEHLGRAVRSAFDRTE